MCKIVSINGWANSDQSKEQAFKFANDIAIASNKQKPIKNKDLIANNEKVKMIKDKIQQQKKFIDNQPIFCEIKNGEFSSLNPDDKDYYKKENVKSIEFFMQLSYAWEMCKPGTAKSGKTKIYDDKQSLDKLLDHIQNNINLYLNLIWIHNRFKKLLKKYNKDTNKQGKKEIKEISNMLKYFDFYNVALIRFIVIFFSLPRTNQSEFIHHLNSIENIDDLKDLANKYKNIKWEIANSDEKSFEQKYLDLNKQFSDKLVEICEKAYDREALDQCHNLVKNDKNFIFFVQEIIGWIKTDSEIRKDIECLIEVQKVQDV